MDFSERILGSTTAAQLRERTGAVLLTIGRDTFTRATLSRVECWNFLAAARLSKILNRDLQVKDTRDLFDRIPWTALAIPDIGPISLAVVGAAFEAKGIGGEKPLEAWVRKHAPAGKKAEESMVTFHTLKAREAEEHQIERKALATRKAMRGRKAHGLRIARFEKRQRKTA